MFQLCCLEHYNICLSCSLAENSNIRSVETTHKCRAVLIINTFIGQLGLYHWGQLSLAAIKYFDPQCTSILCFTCDVLTCPCTRNFWWSVMFWPAPVQPKIHSVPKQNITKMAKTQIGKQGSSSVTQGSHRAPYAKMPNIGGRYGASFIEKGSKYGVL